MRPRHFWPVAAPALIWQIAAAADYLLTVTRTPFYVALFSPELAEFFLGLPLRITAVWALGVWAGLTGTWMMIRGVRGAAMVLAVSAGAHLFFTLWLTVLAWPPLRSVAGPVGDAVMVTSAAISIALWLYARRLRTRRLLP